jgi:Response regulators consisting of a CheY-like receiver domain and a winged-helix DNA-binding domain
MPKIYFVEDDENIKELVLYALKTANFTAQGFDNFRTFETALKTDLPDLILLDIMLPDKDGVAILKFLKNSSRTNNIPVIMLTAKSSEYDRIQGLDLGADDYVTKPFSVLELVSRIKAVLRRTISSGNNNDIYIYKNVELNTKKHTVKVDNQSILLTYKEFELLQFLMKNQGLVLKRDRIMLAVWDVDFEGETRTVDMHIRNLRQKLGSGGEIIQTVRGVGYKVGD